MKTTDIIEQFQDLKAHVANTEELQESLKESLDELNLDNIEGVSLGMSIAIAIYTLSVANGLDTLASKIDAGDTEGFHEIYNSNGFFPERFVIELSAAMSQAGKNLCEQADYLPLLAIAQSLDEDLAAA